MARLALTSAFSRAFGGLFHGAPNRRARCTLGWITTSTRAGGSSRRRVRPCLETLEDRITPSSAANAKDLANVIQKDNTNNSADTILLTGGANDYQLTGQIEITDTAGLIIQGQGQTIDAGHHNRAFLIDTVGGTTIVFQNLTIQNGAASDDGTGGSNTNAEGGGILDLGGNVTLSNVVLQSNQAIGRTGVGPGADALGGGIYVAKGGLLAIQNSEINNNDADGASASDNASFTLATGGDAQGGGIYSLSATTIVNSSVSQNVVDGGDSHSSTGRGGDAEGGGIFASATTYINGSTIEKNSLEEGSGVGGPSGLAAGGGIFVRGQTTIEDSTLTGNILNGNPSQHSHGGDAEGGSAYFAFVANATMSITDSTLSYNNLGGGSGTIDQAFSLNGGEDVGGDAEGGGIYDVSNPMVIDGCDLSNSQLGGGSGTFNYDLAPLSGGTVGGAALGGGIFVNNAFGPSKTDIGSSTITDNAVFGGHGTLDTGTGFSSVGGKASGGGIYATTVNIFNSTLSGNAAVGGVSSYLTPNLLSVATPGLAQGGGAYFYGGVAALINSTIADNQAVGEGGAPDGVAAAVGGGLYFQVQAALLLNDTVADNEAVMEPGSTGLTGGGGIVNSLGTATAMTLINNLVADNRALQDPDYAGTVSSDYDNLIGNADGSTGFPSTANLLGSTANLLNPQLGPLQDNGGALAGAPGSQQVLPTMALMPGSPAINAGDNSQETDTGQFDERGPGFARVVGGTIDLGAFEVQPPQPKRPFTPPLAAPPSPAPPPTLQTPPLLAFFDSLLAAVETINGDGTETVSDRIFGIPLLVSVYDSNGNLLSVTVFGMNVTALFESL